MIPFVLDTDIGTDVDDLLAIATILGSPELELTGVTTVYGDVALRAQMVARSLSIAGASKPTIVAGERETRSGREVWWPGHEGKLFGDLSGETFDQHPPATDLLAAAETIAAIAPMTNVANAVESAGVQTTHIVMMGGEFVEGLIEHNIRSDVSAAAAVFGSGIAVTVVGLEQTGRLRLGADVVSRFDAGGPFGELVAREMRQFWDFTGEASNVPHDPVALLMLAQPHLFSYAAGRVTVEDSGRTHFSADPRGPHRIVTDMDVEEVTTQIVSRIERATATAQVK